MTLYELMLKVNFELIKGRSFTEEEKLKTVKIFLSGISDEKTVKRFHIGVNAPREENGDSRQMYPIFYIPPYKNDADGSLGKKYKTITTVTPLTHILSANAYELEIIRLLAVFAPQNETVRDMLIKTKERLKTTCFGNFCLTGECFESSIIVLRFLGTAFPGDTQWINKLIQGIKEHLFDKKRHSGTIFYYWLSLSELPFEIARSEIERFSVKCDPTTEKYSLQSNLCKSYVMNSEHDKYASPLGKYILRNCLARLDEYSYLKDRQPYVNEKDGRLYFDIENSLDIESKG
ncbi:MAG: hypothetical protein K0S55_926 [Clostridia bacterium]|nr:hypothetical protein [Clostridia bacterium]